MSQSTGNKSNAETGQAAPTSVISDTGPNNSTTLLSSSNAESSSIQAERPELTPLPNATPHTNTFNNDIDDESNKSPGHRSIKEQADANIIANQNTGDLYRQVIRARFWLPITIIGVVLIFQFNVVHGDGGIAGWRQWSGILFYGILGPIVTYLTLSWIASQLKEYEIAQTKLRSLYTDLQASHALLGTIQEVTEQFATADDLETVLTTASRSINRVTNAEGTAVFIGEPSLGVMRGHGLSDSMREDANHRNLTYDTAFNHSDDNGMSLIDDIPLYHINDGKQLQVLSSPVIWGGNLRGSVHSYFEHEPTPDQRESFFILSSELSAVTEAARRRARDLLTLFQVDRSIRAEGNLDHLLETVLEQMMSRAEASIGGIYLSDDAHLLNLRTAVGIETSNYGPLPSIRMGETIVGKTAENIEPIVESFLSQDDRTTLLAKAQSALCLPLVRDKKLLGVVVLAHQEVSHFKKTDLAFFNLLAGQVSFAIRNARAYLESEELAISEERARIAREIHDGIAQTLAFSALKLDLVSRLMDQPEQKEKTQNELKQVKYTIRETIKEVRRSIFALRPVDLDQYGFSETIRRYSVDFGQQNDVQIDLTIDKIPQLTTESEAVLFRIFQESMNNVAKHSKATMVSVEVSTDNLGHAQIEIKDNGRGFNINEISSRVSSAGGLGLKQMLERIQQRGGTLNIHSSPGEGTYIAASVPE